jgi:uncharacterized protein YkwD
MRLCFRFLSAVAFLGLVLPSWGAETKDKPKLELSKDEQAIVDLTNAARAKEKLAPLKANATLCEVARAHSANMAKQQKMDHVLDGKNPIHRLKASGYRYRWMGENIAYSTRVNPTGIVTEWMDSPPHRKNILNAKFREIGVGIVRGEDGNVYYTQVFATPARR